jgi:carbon-monoxide dehydrogenase medium subunit
MPITKEFEYHKPSHLDDVLKLLDTFQAKAKILAGGTDLIVKLKENGEQPDAVIDIKGISALNEIRIEGNALTIGANVTFTELIESKVVKEQFPLLWQASGTVASIGTRNRATVVGNICSAVPSLDSGPALLIYEAEVLLKSLKGERSVPIKQWFIGPKKTALHPGEMVTGLSLPLIKEKHGASYQKLGRYAGEDLAQAGVGIMVTQNLHYRIAYCAVGPVPKRSESIESFLEGKKLTPELIQKAGEMSGKEISPITDIRATKEYRSHMIGVMLERGLLNAYNQIF